MLLHLPEEKFERTQATVKEWLGRKAGRQRELELLVGLLQHAAKVVHPGRRFCDGSLRLCLLSRTEIALCV